MPPLQPPKGFTAERIRACRKQLQKANKEGLPSRLTEDEHDVLAVLAWLLNNHGHLPLATMADTMGVAIDGLDNEEIAIRILEQRSC